MESTEQYEIQEDKESGMVSLIDRVNQEIIVLRMDQAAVLAQWYSTTRRVSDGSRH